MAKLLFRLHNVADDEADEVRDLLRTQQIDFYETDAGRWGISVAALWLVDETRLEEAQRLIDDYQAERSTRLAAEHHLSESLGERLRRQPLTILAYLLLVALVLYFSLMPFLDLGR